MRKTYQNTEIDTSQLAVPDTVSVALAEVAGDLREGLLALAVGTGLQVMAAMMETDVTAACGPKGRHDPQRTATRHGHGAGSVTLGGRRVPVERPRMRTVDGSGELAVASYELFSGTEVLGRMALDRMLAGLSTRRYPVGLEPVGTRTEQVASSTSRSAVSRRFVAASPNLSVPPGTMRLRRRLTITGRRRSSTRLGTSSFSAPTPSGNRVPSTRLREPRRARQLRRYPPCGPAGRCAARIRVALPRARHRRLGRAQGPCLLRAAAVGLQHRCQG